MNVGRQPTLARPGERGRLRRFATLALPAAFGACAYFNGVYNAKEAEGRANKLLRSGREGEAVGS